ncbi:AraC family transcriptional regulator [Mycobacterium sp. 21AC1]|uniref:helix-turn-helix transcriptional regulator n=1 Tax=[Mycobacterium] appelbergii TaxID=2939269 RepID=UPI002939287C|nr:AraC family transcriptional regulator [Mycobacterium sp. 21AC1]MDV3128817.1 AraC family transcriptional regulator [Mycobacterium sp. 21AC1]
MDSTDAVDYALGGLWQPALDWGNLLPNDAVSTFDTFVAHDRDSAEERAAQVLSPHRLTLEDPRSKIDTVYRIGPYGAVSIYAAQYGAGVTIDRSAQSNYMIAMLPFGGRMDGRHQRQEFYAPPGVSTVVLSEGDPVHMRWERRTRVLGLRADLGPLTDRLTMLAPETRVRSPLRFDPVLVSRPIHQILLGTMQLLAQSSVSGVGPSRMVARLAENAMDAVLLALPHNYSRALNEPMPPISRRTVKSAVDRIASEQGAEYTVGELARLAGVSLRTLEAGFRAELDCTPLQYLRRSRLAKAHAELVALKGASETTVGSVAARWGFFHMGRFAADFRQQFGTSPSQVLRTTSRGH